MIYLSCKPQCLMQNPLSTSIVCSQVSNLTLAKHQPSQSLHQSSDKSQSCKLKYARRSLTQCKPAVEHGLGPSTQFFPFQTQTSELNCHSKIISTIPIYRPTVRRGFKWIKNSSI